MKRAEKVARIQTILNDLYPTTPVPLLHDDPYTLLVAVLLSAQCTDARVNTVTPHLFARARTPHEMLTLDVEEIRGIIKPCGLSPTKSKNIWNLSHKIVHEFGGEVPRDEASLESLPGVGHKTAAVVLAQAFDVPAFPVDTHIHRLAIRWGLTKGKNVVQTERDLKKVFPAEDWHKVHLQIIFFGREHCPALYHDLDACPICGWASTAKQKREEAKRIADMKARRGKKKPGGDGGG